MAQGNASASVGKVIKMTGSSFLEMESGKVDLAEGSSVFKGGVVYTQAASHVEIRFNDDTILSQGENSSITIDDYVFSPEDEGPGNLLFQMGKGTFRVITGKIAEHNPENFNIKTPLATIGIRGTEFYIESLDTGEKITLGDIDEGHIVSITDEFGTLRFLDVAGKQMVIQEGVPMGPVQWATPEEIQRIKKSVPISSVTTGNGDDDVETEEEAAAREAEEEAAKAAEEAEEAEKEAEEAAKEAEEAEAAALAAEEEAAALAAEEEAAKLAAEEAALAEEEAAAAVAEAEAQAQAAAEAQTQAAAEAQAQAAAEAMAQAVADVQAAAEARAAADAKVAADAKAAADAVQDAVDAQIAADAAQAQAEADVKVAADAAAEAIRLAAEATEKARLLEEARIQALSQPVSFSGTDGDDIKVGGTGNDTLSGGLGNDLLSGIAGDDVIKGGEGFDALFGGDGNDIIKGGEGIDALYGGAGDDTFVNWGTFAAGTYTGQDAVDAFKDDLSGGNSLELAHVKEASYVGEPKEIIDGGEGSDTLITYGTAVFTNTTLTSIETIITHSDNTFGATQLEGAGVTAITGDGDAIIRFVGSGEADLSGINMTGISDIIINNGIVLKVSGTQLSTAGVKNIQGNGTATIKFVGSSTADLSNLTISGMVNVEVGADVELVLSSTSAAGINSITSTDGNPVTVRISGTDPVDLSNIDLTDVVEVIALPGVIITIPAGSSVTVIEGTVNITNVNDVAPVMTAGGPFSLAEDAVQGTSPGTVASTDVDTTGELPSYSIVSGNTDGYFQIDSATGEITVTAAGAAGLDYETTTSYTLGVEASDGVNTSVTENFTVNITDVNDTAPVMTAGGPFSVAEDAVQGAVVGTAASTDADTTGESPVYSIVSGDPGGYFQIDSGTGEITVTVAGEAGLDYETTTSYTLGIQSSDGVNTSVTENFTVNITDVNDTAPVMTAGGPFSVAEDAVQGAVVGTAASTDADTTGESPVYSIVSGNPDGYFQIDSGTGEITVSAAGEAGLDYETTTSYTLGIEASDGTNISATENFTVNITDVNDVAPVMTAGGSFSIAEDVVQGTSVGIVVSTDSDTTGESPIYSIVSGNTDGYFQIDSGTGEITVSAAGAAGLDYETTTSYTLGVEASDGTNISATENFTVNITDVNDTAPVMTAGVPFSVAEDAVQGAVVGTAASTDADTTGESPVYSIVSGDPGGYFQIDSGTGEITVTVAGEAGLDFETTTSYTLGIQSSDGVNTSVTENFTVNITDVNDTAPVMTAGGPFSVAEDAVQGAVVGTAASTDADTTGESPVYSIVSGNTDGYFQIDSATGEITVTAAGAAGLDYETTTSYTLGIEASDGTNISVTENFTVNITDVNGTAPVMTAGGPFSIAEDVVQGASVGTVASTDADTTGESPIYSIVSGNTDGYFQIDSGTGEITVTAAGEAGLDYETTTSYTLGVEASDGTNISVTENFTVNITDLNDTAPVMTAGGPFSIAEDAAQGTSLGTVASTDTDTTGESPIYSIVSGNTDGYFQIDSGTGEITVTAAGEAGLDYETTASYTLGIEASDGTNISITENFMVNITDLNDTAPMMTAGGPFSIAEDAVQGTSLGTVASTDADTTGESPIYSIVSGDPSGYFQIDSATGEITVTSAGAAGLDYETTTSYTLGVQASDGVNTSVTENFTVNITDVNDVAPVMTAGGPFSIAEDAAQGTSLGTVASTDTDTTGESPIYSIVSGNTDGYFQIDSGTGEITVTAAGEAGLDYETTTSYTLGIEASEGVNTSVTENFTVNITDVNDVAPVMTAGGPFSIAEDVVQSASVGTVSSTDTDTTGESPIYSIVSGNTDGYFQIDSGTGEITVTAAGAAGLDYETTTSYTLGIEASDGINTSVTENFTVNITDVNDAAPVMTAGGPFSIAEDAAQGTSLGTVASTDADTTGESPIYSIVSGDPGGYFQIDSGTGEITVSAAGEAGLDYETTTSYTLGIEAGDGTNTSVTENFTVNISSVNDNAPILTANTLVVDEGQSLVLTSANFNATDSDIPADTLTFTVSGVTGGDFQLVSNSSSVSSFTLAQINAGEIKFVDNGDEVSPSFDTVVSDSLNDSGAPAAASITYTPVNDVPVNTVSAAQSVAESTTTILTDLSVADSDGDNITVVLTASGGETITFTNVGAASVTQTDVDGSDGSMTIIGTVADINTVLAAGVEVTAGTADFTLSMQSTDDGTGALSDSDAVAFTVNNAPVNTVSAAQSVAESTTTTLTDLSVADSDGDNITVVLTASGGETITFTNVGAASVTQTDVDGSDGSMTIIGTVADINTVLAAGVEVTAGTADFTLFMQSTDDGIGALADTDTVAFTVNNAPVNTVPTILTPVENATTILTDLSVSDAEVGTLTVVLTTSGGETITFTNVGAGAVTQTDIVGTDGSMTISGSVADINAVLAAGVEVTAGTADFTLTMQTTDDGAGALSDTDSVFFSPVGSGTDTIVGTDGDDIINMGTSLDATDTIDGGDGNDTLTFIDNNWATNDLDGVTNIENIILYDGSSPYEITTPVDFVGSGNTLTVDASAVNSACGGIFIWDGSSEINGNFDITGSQLVDDLTGGAGNDYFRMGANLNSSDTIDGGDGNDTLTFIDSNGVVTDLDGVTNIENIIITGTPQATITTVDGLVVGGDTLTVDATAAGDNCTGGLIWNGSAETDSNFNITGSSFDDTLTGGLGDDIFTGGAGGDSFDGGGGIDTISYANDGGTGNIGSSGVGVTVNLNTATATDTWGNTDTISFIENVIGSDLIFGDIITGNAQANNLQGGAGNDTIDGGAGNDVLIGGADDDILTGGDGIDSFDGGAGNDTISYANDGGTTFLGVTINLTETTATDTWGNPDTIVFDGGVSTIENVIGSADNDTITGDARANDLQGGDGDDVLDGGLGIDSIDGGAGNDVLIGGADDDILTGGAGIDSFDGGAGNDTISFAGATTAVSIDLTSATIADDGEGNTDVETITSIENVIGSANDDTITGDATVKNILEGGAGLDTITGGDSTDVASFASSTGAVTVDLSLGTNQVVNDGYTNTETLANIQNILGSANGDTITGDANANTLDGGPGDDSLTSGAGNDILIGGDGYDVFTFAEAGAANADMIMDFHAWTTNITFDEIRLDYNYFNLTTTGFTSPTTPIFGTRFISGADITSALNYASFSSITSLVYCSLSPSALSAPLITSFGLLFYDSDGSGTTVSGTAVGKLYYIKGTYHYNTYTTTTATINYHTGPSSFTNTQIFTIATLVGAPELTDSDIILF